MHYIQFGSCTIEYELTWSKLRKSISISVDQNVVKVIAPEITELGKIEDILYKKGAWIRTLISNFEETRVSNSSSKIPALH